MQPVEPWEERYRFSLVIPNDLMAKVKIAAKRDHRSVTAQIICALEWMTREVKVDESATAPE